MKDGTGIGGREGKERTEERSREGRCKERDKRRRVSVFLGSGEVFA